MKTNLKAAGYTLLILTGISLFIWFFAWMIENHAELGLIIFASAGILGLIIGIFSIIREEVRIKENRKKVANKVNQSVSKPLTEGKYKTNIKRNTGTTKGAPPPAGVKSK